MSHLLSQSGSGQSHSCVRGQGRAEFNACEGTLVSPLVRQVSRPDRKREAAPRKQNEISAVFCHVSAKPHEDLVVMGKMGGG